MSLLVNGLDVASMRWLAPWSGMWTAELELQGNVEIVPSGRVVIASTDGIALVGTVDADRSGSFGEKRHVRVIGGAGWRKSVRAQHYNSSIGVPLTVVASTTAAEVGEVATVLTPQMVGLDFVRQAGEASQIFVAAGVDWWVGADGVTRVGARLPAVPSPDLHILDWDPSSGAMSFASSVLVEPGTVLVDTRFGTRIVRSVEAKVEGGSVRGTLWTADSPPKVGTAMSELVEGLAALANQSTRSSFGRLYEYRVISMAGDRVALQAVKKSVIPGVPSVGEMPDIIPASIWAGISGYKATLRPASRVLVGFIGGDPRRPYVAAYEPPEGAGWRPVVLELDGTAAVKIGELAAAVVLGPALGALPVARAPGVIAFANAVAVAVSATAAAATATGPVPVTGATLGGFLATLATAIASAASTLTTACPSAKVVSS